ncbi:MAG TPA: hypothetical protein VF221_15625 [Chloroflexota bacterium]
MSSSAPLSGPSRMLPLVARLIPGRDREARLRSLALTHGTYYTVTGIWPVIDIRSFQALTGRKRDIWLVKTAGLLIACIGLVLSMAGIRRTTEPAIPVLGVTSALSLAGIDIVYVGRRVIPPIYLADAAAEIALVMGWLAASTAPIQKGSGRM